MGISKQKTIISMRYPVNSLEQDIFDYLIIRIVSAIREHYFAI